MKWNKIIAVAGIAFAALKYISENNQNEESYDSYEVVAEEATKEDFTTNTLKTLSEYKPEPITNSTNVNSTIHTDSRYKYEYRTGSSGDYEYNYDVSGSGGNGSLVNGYVEMQGEYGYGTITDDEGNEVDVDVEWTGYGTLQATDAEGNTYDLEAY